MPNYSQKDILELDNPYVYFNKSGVLAQHKKLLDDLTESKKKELALKMIKACPQKELKKFGYLLKSIASPMSNKETFYSVIEPIHQVKTRILGFLDIKNKNPCHTLRDSMNLFNQHQDFVLENLALLTPIKKHNEVIQQINSVFAQGNFTHDVGMVFTLIRNIQHLTTDKPELFFTSSEFNYKFCNRFLSLFDTIKGLEKDIGIKLAKKPSVELLCNLELLSTSCQKQENPFTKILNTTKIISHSPANNPNSLFAKYPQKPDQAKQIDKSLNKQI
ncbi:hypothetical protein [Legionella sp.]|uniref:hypothetical protein n=1 Tax=Legionella sp. TaxID=459 RepID=UPI003CAB0630